MKIKKITIDKKYFEEDIEHKMNNESVKKKNIINITQDKHFTTLWYWCY